MRAYFVAGTDTEIGKTTVTLTLLRLFQRVQMLTVGIKPLAAGAFKLDGDWVNEDGLALQEASSIYLPYEAINPYLLLQPLSPHIAAKRDFQEISVKDMCVASQDVLNTDLDMVLVEGAGGWRCPVNDKEVYSDYVKALDLPVILVVGMRLGCLNHTLLTAEAIAADGLEIAGWVPNILDPNMEALEENIQTLMDALDAPCLGVMPYVSGDLDVDRLEPFGDFAAVSVEGLLERVEK